MWGADWNREQCVMLGSAFVDYFGRPVDVFGILLVCGSPGAVSRAVPLFYRDIADVAESMLYLFD